LNFQALLTGFDDLLTSIAWLALLVPRTIWRILSRPSWIGVFVRGELLKAPADRFREFAPPMLLCSAVLAFMGLVTEPYAARLDAEHQVLLMPKEHVRPYPYRAPTSTWLVGGDIRALSVEKVLLFYAATGLGGLLGATVMVRRLAGRGGDYSYFRPVFLAQCYCMVGWATLSSVAHVAGVGWVRIVAVLVGAPVIYGSPAWAILSGVWMATVAVLIVGSFLWLTYAEAHVVRLELHQAQVRMASGAAIVFVWLVTYSLVGVLVFPETWAEAIETWQRVFAMVG
jgi:hypothetical protein